MANILKTPYPNQVLTPKPAPDDRYAPGCHHRRRGTGGRANIGRPAAGKTGTPATITMPGSSATPICNQHLGGLRRSGPRAEELYGTKQNRQFPAGPALGQLHEGSCQGYARYRFCPSQWNSRSGDLQQVWPPPRRALPARIPEKRTIYARVRARGSLYQP